VCVKVFKGKHKPKGKRGISHPKHNGGSNRINGSSEIILGKKVELLSYGRQQQEAKEEIKERVVLGG